MKKQTAKEAGYQRMLNEVMTSGQLIYCTVPCSTRAKSTADRAKQYISKGEYARALKLADPIAYSVGLSEFES